MSYDSTLIVDASDGIERRLSYGVAVFGAEAFLALEAGDAIQLSEGDLRFLKRALAAIDLPPLRPSFVPDFELDEPAERAPSRPQADPLPRQAGKPWTEEDNDTLTRLYCAGTPTAAIAQALNRTETAILGRLIAKGLATLQPTQPLQETHE